MRNRVVIGLVATLALATAGCGSDDGASAGGERLIEVEMKDNAFSPEIVTVEAGQQVRFVFDNVGEADHEAILGDEDFQAEHEEEMNPPTTEGDDSSDSSTGGATTHETNDDMEHGSMDPNGITVEPGEKGELSRTFAADDDGIVIGCHEPGHYAAGMLIKVSVS